MKHPTQDRTRRQLGVGPAVHAGRRPRRTHESRVRFAHVVGASLALAALSYLATAKAEPSIVPGSVYIHVVASAALDADSRRDCR